MNDTLETKDPRVAAIEAKVRQAKEYTGATFDARINKFTAAITIGGKRKYLGSFDTALEAGASYEIARSENPIIRKRGANGEALSFAAAYREFLKEEQRVTGKKYGRVEVGAIFYAPDEQRYEMVEIKYRATKGKKRWVFYRWKTACRVCGISFEAQSLAGKEITGIGRNCVEHRGMVTPSIGPEVYEIDPAVFSDAVNARCLELGLVRGCGREKMEAVVAEVRAKLLLAQNTDDLV